MSFRALSRAVPRSAPRVKSARGYASSSELIVEGKPNQAWLEKQEAIRHHAAGVYLHPFPF